MHRYLLVVVVAAAAAIAGGCGRGAGATLQLPDATLRAEILRRVAEDQAVRDSFALQLRTIGTATALVDQRLRAVDSANLAWLRPLLGSSGLPTRGAVGADGVEAVLLLIQHADGDPAFQARVLPLVEAAFHAGDLEGEELAMLTDRVLKAQGRAQRYGTQTTIAAGVVRFDPIEDSSGVDARRARLGLLPLAAYKRLVDSVYGRPEVRTP